MYSLNQAIHTPDIFEGIFHGHLSRPIGTKSKYRPNPLTPSLHGKGRDYLLAPSRLREGVGVRSENPSNFDPIPIYASRQVGIFFYLPELR